MLQGISGALYLRLQTDVGLTGLGQPGLTDPVQCGQAIGVLRPLLLGTDPRRTVDHWQRQSRHAYHRGGARLAAAVSAVDMALWDLAGKAAGLPVHMMVGDACRDHIRVCDTLHVSTPEQVASRLKQSTAAGHTAGLLRLQEDPVGGQDLVSILETARAAAGRAYELAVDLSALGPIPDPQRLLPAVERCAPLFVQLSPQQHRFIDDVQQNATEPTLVWATGEDSYPAGEPGGVLAGRFSVIRPDVSQGGGIREALRRSGLALRQGGQIAPCATGQISLLASLHLCACLPALLIQSMSCQREQDLTLCHDLDNGHMVIPQQPGLGADLLESTSLNPINDWEAVI